MNVYVVRHAQSRSQMGLNVINSSEPLLHPELEKYDTTDPALTALGRQQADLLGQRLSQVDFDYIFSGPLQRHVETAYGVVRYQKKCKTIEIIHDLNETGDELCNGLPIDIMRSIYPGMEIIPSPNPTRTGGPYDIPESEISPEGFLRRARRIEEFIKENIPEGSNVLLVTSCNYGGCVLIPALLGLSDDEINSGRPYNMHNTSISLVRYISEEGIGDFPACEFINDISHLIVPKSVDVSKLPLFN